MPNPLDLIREIDELQKESSKTPWLTPEETGDPYSEKCPVDHEGCKVWPWENRYDMLLAYRLVNNYEKLRALALAGIELSKYMEEACELPETGLKRNVKSALSKYREATKDV